jgi:hypothetical protein
LTWSSSASIRDFAASKNSLASFNVFGRLINVPVIFAPFGGAVRPAMQTATIKRVTMSGRPIRHSTIAHPTAMALGIAYTGDTASLVPAGSFAMGNLQISANGVGLSANPTVVFTFPKNEAGSQKPNIVWSRSDGTIEQAGFWLISSISSIDITWVFVGTPGAGQNIGIQWIISMVV